MEDRVKKIIYRLYGLAESNYWTHYKEFQDREEVVAYGDQDDPECCSDEWTMLRSDYNMIQDAKVALEEYYKDTATFVLPLEGKNEEDLQRLRENGGDTLTLERPSPDNTDESKFSVMDYMLKEESKAQYHSYMSFEEFIYKNHAEIWDNCPFAGKWITLIYIDYDKAKVRVTEKEPEVVLDFSKGVTHKGYTYGGTWIFDWSDFYNGKYKYEDVFLDIPAGFQLDGPLESFKIKVDDDFWTPTMQTFSPD